MTEYVEGLRDITNALSKLHDDMPQYLKEEVFIPIGEMVAADARSMVPKRTGRLAASIKPTKTKNKAAVRVGGARVPYAGVIEYGWPRRGIKPNPYLVTAIDRNKDKALQMLEDGLATIIHGVGLSPE